ncbi:hypothetical protein FHU41_001318 [Psychromicrobium silvestre]|uniref:Uncharacterized protein n=1 Tax=Psychromicrobium silvestre TaxID=1645614 RepID=A0A7Y9LT41_9MICC|nr:hypothetical protein [Psychromicrobium silvestre]NYE95097.1 hypothetical protein [Psychromicrobium silvestre]
MTLMLQPAASIFLQGDTAALLTPTLDVELLKFRRFTESDANDLFGLSIAQPPADSASR